jgi:hypothetical protein
MTLVIKKTLLESNFLALAEKSTFSIFQNPSTPKFSGVWSFFIQKCAL